MWDSESYHAIIKRMKTKKRFERNTANRTARCRFREGEICRQFSA
jgi:hypothetical protein